MFWQSRRISQGGTCPAQLSGVLAWQVVGTRSCARRCGQSRGTAAAPACRSQHAPGNRGQALGLDPASWGSSWWGISPAPSTLTTAFRSDGPATTRVALPSPANRRPARRHIPGFTGVIRPSSLRGPLDDAGRSGVWMTGNCMEAGEEVAQVSPPWWQQLVSRPGAPRPAQSWLALQVQGHGEVRHST